MTDLTLYQRLKAESRAAREALDREKAEHERFVEWERRTAAELKAKAAFSAMTPMQVIWKKRQSALATALTGTTKEWEWMKAK